MTPMDAFGQPNSMANDPQSSTKVTQFVETIEN
jgi:hypothetical protein